MGNGKKKKNELFDGLSPATKIKLLAEQLEAEQTSGPITVTQEPHACPKCAKDSQLTVFEQIWACLECGSSGWIANELPQPLPAPQPELVSVGAGTNTADTSEVSSPSLSDELPGPPIAPSYAFTLNLNDLVDEDSIPPNSVVSFHNGGVDTDPVVAKITSSLDGYDVHVVPATSPHPQDLHVATWDQALEAIHSHLEHCPGCGQFISPMIAHTCPHKTAHSVVVANAVGAMNALAMATSVDTYEDSVEMYNASTQLIEEAKATLVEAGVGEAEMAAYTSELAKAQLEVLQTIPDEHLQLLANDAGIAHPMLVSPDSIRFYLQTAYWQEGDDGALTPGLKQAKVALAADTRYAMLQAGGEVNGMTLDNYLETVNASLLPSPSEPATATQDEPTASSASDPGSIPPALTLQEVTAIKERLDEILEKTKNSDEPLTDERKAQLLRESIVLTAKLGGNVEEDAQGLADSTLNGISMLSHRLRMYGGKYNSTHPDYVAFQGALEDLGLDPQAANYWRAHEIFTHDTARRLGKPAEFVALTDERVALIKTYGEDLQVVVPYMETSNGYWGYGDVDMQALDLAVANGDITYAKFFTHQANLLHRDKSLTEARVMPAVQDVHKQVLPEDKQDASFHALAGYKSNQLIKEWAATKDLSELRAIAEGVGLQNAAAANRSQVTGYLTATTSPSNNTMDDWQNSVNNAAIKKEAKAAAFAEAKAKGLTAAAMQSGGGFGAGFKVGPDKPKMEPKVMAFHEHAAYAALAAQHMHASHEPIPARLTEGDLGSMGFTPAPNPGLGGMHSKDFYADDQGRTWMAKRYKSATGGASVRCATEAAASAIMGKAVPTVPVYQHTVGGAVAAMQPLIQHAGPISTDASTYSQADVDAIVRMHVATWMVGDHDLHSGNVLRTQGGGLVPIDHGQAFKHFGSDKLATDYHPNKQYGETPPVWQGLYKAAQTGQLAEGVRVRPVAAVQAIEAFEAIDDADYRAMLEPVAKAGAGSESTFWRKSMRDKAAKRHKVAKGEVTTEQIAEEFITHAIERKKNLRQDFARFFVFEGWVEAKEALAP